MKNPPTPAGIEPATFRFVAQHFSHCATAVPTRILPEIKTETKGILFNRTVTKKIVLSFVLENTNTSCQTPRLKSMSVGAYTYARGPNLSVPETNTKNRN